MLKSRGTFREFSDPMYLAFGTTEDRVPLTDWYWTDSGDQRGFPARSVGGGYLIKMLEARRR